MANGQQKAEENLHVFLAWANSKSDAEFRNMVSRGNLRRAEIAAECEFSRSVFVQNPRVKEALGALEDGLRARGVLPEMAPPNEGSEETPPPIRSNKDDADKARLKRLEAENASLRAELAKLRGDLSRFRLMDTVLAETGRLPR